MASKVFLDANFLIDLALQRASHAAAVQVIQHAIAGSIQLFTTPAVLHITSYFISQSFTTQQTKQILLTLLNDVQVIDCDHTTALAALNSSLDDIEDALQYYTALKFKLHYFISSDKRLKKAGIPQLPVFTAAELLTELGLNE